MVLPYAFPVVAVLGLLFLYSRHDDSTSPVVTNMIVHDGLKYSAPFAESPPRVKMTVYLEALCIDSKRFVLDQLVPTFDLLGPSVIDLDIVPFGNAKLVEHDNDSETKGTVTCQHGNAECDANVYELCATSLYQGNPSRYLPFFACLFATLPMHRQQTLLDTSLFAACARHAAIEFSDSLAKHCHDDPARAWQLQVDANRRTPPHDHVPWVVFNDGPHTMDEFHDSLLEVVCLVYENGGVSHPVCSNL